MRKELLFKVAIGDWSNDGHGRCEWFRLRAEASTIEEVREAYFRARGKVPEPHHPENFGEKGCPQDLLDKMGVKGLERSEQVAAAVAWFITQGGVPCELARETELPTLSFYGYDKEGRHISFIGYAMLNPF